MGNTQALLHDAHRFGPAAPDEQYIYGSCAPGWHAAADHDTCVREWIDDMQSAGIERVCCLIAANDDEAEQANVGIYREEFGPDRTLHASTPTNGLVEQERLEADILPFLDEAAANGEPTVVHGLSGLGRTGEVLAAWLAYDRGYSPTRAVRIIQEFGRDPTEVPADDQELFEILEAVRGPETEY
jgi:protein-tyrosine phosphatase